MSGAGATLSAFEGELSVPFAIKRVYYLYDISADMRGGHAHLLHKEVLIPLSGGFTLTLHDGTEKREYRMKSSNVGIYYPQMLWHELSDFLPNTIVLALASELYDKNDYFHTFADFQAALIDYNRNR